MGREGRERSHVEYGRERERGGRKREGERGRERKRGRDCGNQDFTSGMNEGENVRGFPHRVVEGLDR